MPEYKSSNRAARKLKDKVFRITCVFAAVVAIGVLLTLLVSIAIRGVPRLDWSFITRAMSSDPHQTGIGPALVGSISILFICALSAIPLGVATAILLEEYKPRHKFLQVLHGFVQSNITNLAGVPSIVYGILGFSVFVLMFGLLGSYQSPVVDIGQDFYLEYPGAGGQSYYVKSYEDAPLSPAEQGMDVKFYPSLDAAEADEPIDVTVAEPGELAAIREAVEKRLYEINSTMKQALRAATVDGKTQIDDEKAKVVAEQMLSPFKGKLQADYDRMTAVAVEHLKKMDGMGAVDLIAPRRELRRALIEEELNAAGLTGIIIAGTKPLAKDVKHWYYFQIPFGKGVLAGGLTLMLVILPIIIVASQEAIRAVPQSMRHGCLALGGTKWQSIEQVVLPAAIPGICTGSILAMSRAIGEAAPVLLIGYVGLQSAPDNMMSAFAALPLEIFNWTSEPDVAFRNAAAAGIIVLLAVLLTFNAIAVFIRQKLQKQY